MLDRRSWCSRFFQLSRANFSYNFATGKVYDVTQFLDGTHYDDLEDPYPVSFL